MTDKPLTINALNSCRRLANRLNVPVKTPTSAEQARRQALALIAYEQDGNSDRDDKR